MAALVWLCGGCALPGSGVGATAPADATGESLLGVDKQKKPRDYIVPVFVIDLVRGPMEAYLSTVGNLYPVSQQVIAPEISGVIAFASAWKEGDFVAAGTLLAELDNEEISFAVRDAKLKLSADESQLGPALAKLDKAKSDLDFFKRQYERGAVSKDELERRELAVIDAESAVTAARNAIAAAKSALEKAELRAKKSKLFAPFDGQLVNKEFLATQRTSQEVEPLTRKEGQLVQPGEALFGIFNDKIMRVEVDVSGKDIGKVRPGQRALVHVYAQDGIDTVGRVADISTSVDPTSRAFKVQVHVDNSERRLSRGMFARCDLVVEERADALAIPREVTQMRNNRLVVFVVDDDGIARERAVELGIENRTHAEVTSGLLEGERLIVRGAETLKDGTPVKASKLDETLSSQPGQTVSQRS
ncbi:efflux RND transporter periplasmic adaptor subunit [bacterium]|nr:efflux RND transporter periplasmic adaptor subunit [bacterium]